MNQQLHNTHFAADASLRVEGETWAGDGCAHNTNGKNTAQIRRLQPEGNRPRMSGLCRNMCGASSRFVTGGQA